MPDLLYFMPDPEIPDADLLGYGDLVLSDGTTRYLSGDPELVAGLPPPPTGVQPRGSLGMGPPAPPPAMGPPPVVIQNDDGQPYTIDPTGNIQPGANGVPLEQLQQQMQGVQDPQTGELLSPGMPSEFSQNLGGVARGLVGEIGNAAQGYPQPFGQSWREQMGGQQSPAAAPSPAASAHEAPAPMGGAPFTGAQQPEPLMGADGRAYQIDMTGNFVPVERQGALPQDVAQRQAQQMGAQNAATLAATEQARRDESRMMNELTLQQMAQLEAQRAEQERAVAEEQAKVQRWQEEQQQLADMEIETDLISARGPVGGVLAAIGAALMGAAGNDTGFRMIENQIDRHVRAQVQRRDTKLNLLAQQIGSSQQAIKMGKAALYDAAAKKAELLAQKTKSDVFEAQTPAVIEQLRQKQLENMQAAEKDSLGKLIERVAQPPKPPSDAALQKYGELRRDRDASIGMAQRIEQQIGLMWSPGKNGQPGHYANADEVRKKGIQGVGNLEQWLPDFVYSTMGGTTAEGYQVRGAAEALAYATIRQMQPTGPISNADIKAAVKANALDTEEGLIRAVERIRTSNEAAEAHDSAQFGADVVTEYNRRFQASGGQLQTAAPAASRPATVEEMRGASSALRQQKGGVGKPSQEELARVVEFYADQAGLNPEAIRVAINIESAGKPNAKNPNSTATGMLQMLESTARSLGTSTAQLSKMSAEEQLPFITEYFKRTGLTADDPPSEYYLAVAAPGAVGKPDDFVIYKQGSPAYDLNPRWDANQDGIITAGDLRAVGRRRSLKG
jgi:hypothetical protein